MLPYQSNFLPYRSHTVSPYDSNDFVFNPSKRQIQQRNGIHNNMHPQHKYQRTNTTKKRTSFSLDIPQISQDFQERNNFYNKNGLTLEESLHYQMINNIPYRQMQNRPQNPISNGNYNSASYRYPMLSNRVQPNIFSQNYNRGNHHSMYYQPSFNNQMHFSSVPLYYQRKINYGNRNSIIQPNIPFISADLQTHRQFLKYLNEIYSLNGKKIYDQRHEEYLISAFKNKKGMHFYLLQQINLNFRLLSASMKNSFQKLIGQYYPSVLDYGNQLKKIKQTCQNKSQSFIKLTNQIWLFSKTFQTKHQFQWSVNKFCLSLFLIEQMLYSQQLSGINSCVKQLVVEVSEQLQSICSLLIQNEESLAQFHQDENLYLKIAKAIFQLISFFSFDLGGQQFLIQYQPSILKNIDDLLQLYSLNQVDTSETLRVLCVEMIKQYLEGKKCNKLYQKQDKMVSITEKRLFNYTLNKMLLLKKTRFSSSDKSAKIILKQLLFYIQMTDLLEKDVSFQRQRIFMIKKRFMDHISTKKKKDVE